MNASGTLANVKTATQKSASAARSEKPAVTRATARRTSVAPAVTKRGRNTRRIGADAARQRRQKT
jgi:hypothetical protein